MSGTSNDHRDEWAIYKAACAYAAGADRRDKALWESVLAPDCVIESANFRTEGLENNLKNLDFLASLFEMTQHRVHNQLMKIDGDVATGETYCTADHVSTVEGKRQVLSWAIRYQDRLVRDGDRWLFTERKLIVDWEETRVIG